MKTSHRAFTLIELMLVMAIMGLLGTVSVGGYRAMRRGMEDRGVMNNVNSFIQNAYERAIIDGQPVAIYFWNETRVGENDEETGLVVVGHAVAVRRAGRISRIDSGENCLVDEFGDWRHFVGTDEDGEEDDAEAKQQANASKTWMSIYRMDAGGDLDDNRYFVAPTTVPVHQELRFMLTDADWEPTDKEVKEYGYKVREGSISEWKAGDSYGVEFADMTLPNNFIFENSYQKDVKSPIEVLAKALWFYPPSYDGTKSGDRTVTVSAIRPAQGTGEPAAQAVDTTTNPEND